MRGLHENLRPGRLAADALSLLERAEGGEDDSAPLLFGRGVGPAVVRQRRRVQQEVDGRHVDFDELLLQVGKVLLQTHSEKRNTDGGDLHSAKEAKTAGFAEPPAPSIVQTSDGTCTPTF